MTNTTDLAAALKLLNVPADIANHILATVEVFASVNGTVAEIAEELSWSKGGGYGGDQLAKWYTDAVALSK